MEPTRTMPRFEDIKETFEFLEDWSDKYAHLIDLGKSLEPLEQHEKVDTNKVDGCMSQVWLVSGYNENGSHIYIFKGDSDALIVKGLVSLVLILFSYKTSDEIQKTDAHAAFAELGLDTHLSMGRRNGLESMVRRIKTMASNT